MALTDTQQAQAYVAILAIRQEMDKFRPFMLGHRAPGTSRDTYTAMGSWIATMANQLEPLLDANAGTSPNPPLP